MKNVDFLFAKNVSGIFHHSVSGFRFAFPRLAPRKAEPVAETFNELKMAMRWLTSSAVSMIMGMMMTLEEILVEIFLES